MSYRLVINFSGPVMSEPPEKRYRRSARDREFEEMQFEPFPEMVNARLIEAVKALNPAAIQQALAEGAQPNLTIDNEPLVRYMRRMFVNSIRENPEAVSRETYKQLLDSIVQFPNRDRELGDDWQFYLLHSLNFPENLFQQLYHNTTPRWLDLILASEGRVPRNYVNEIVSIILKKYHQRSELLQYSDKTVLGRENITKFANYPLFGLGVVLEFCRIALQKFDHLPMSQKLILCSVEPITEGYSSMENMFKQLLNDFAAKGFVAFRAWPIRMWWDFVNIYLYGVKAMAKTEFAPFIPYVIETEIVPIAGHLDRVKYLPGFKMDMFKTVMGRIQNSLRELAEKCHNDPDVRKAMSEQK